MRSAVALALLLACQSQRTEPAANRTDVTAFVGAAQKAAIVDGKLVLVDGARMRLVDPSGRELASVPVTRGIQLLVATDHAVIAGWGITRDHMDTKAAFTRHALPGLVEEPLLAPETTRQDVVAAVPGPDGLLLAYFESKYMVTSMLGARKLATIRTATSYARGDVDGNGTPDLVVGRVYGDATGSDGDAFVLAPDGTRTPIPTTRGLRSLAIADGTIFFGDGWHQNYGKNARGLLSAAHFVNGAFHTEVIEDTNQLSIEQIVPATLGGKPAIVTRGDKDVRVYRKDGEHWRGTTIGGVARDIAVGDLDGKPGDEILIVAEHSEIVRVE